MSAPVKGALRRLPPLGDSSGPLGPGLLASGLQGTIIRDLQAGLADPDRDLSSLTAVSGKPFVPDDFDPPRRLEVPEFHLSGDAQVRFWVRADVAELDGPLHAAVSRWLLECWPFERVIYADRP